MIKGMDMNIKRIFFSLCMLKLATNIKDILACVKEKNKKRLSVF